MGKHPGLIIIHSFISGPYMFLVSFGTYLVSKEIYVLEHEFYCGVALFGKCRLQWKDTIIDCWMDSWR